MKRILVFFKSYLFRVLIISLLIALVIPLTLYFLTFNRTSSEINDWAGFSNFWNPFLALANTIVVFYLTYYLHTLASNQEKIEQLRNAILERPSLSLSQKEDKSSYEITNVGRGSAINVRAYCSGGNDFDLKRITSHKFCYSLGAGSKFSRPWLNGMFIILEYTDVFSTKYFSFMQDDTLYIFDENFDPLIGSSRKDMNEASDKIKKYMGWEKPNADWP